MDFSDLMNIAANKQQVTEQKVKGKKSKGGNPSQVSSDAVKAFLARKNAEKERQKEQEEAAKRARIKARLQQEQGNKSNKKTKSDTSNVETNFENRRQSHPEKERHHKMPAVQLSRSQTKQKTDGNKRSAHETKYSDTKRKEIRMKRPDEKRVDKRNENLDKKRPPSTSKKSAAPNLSFEELMNVAKLQANNPDAIRNLTANRQLKEKEKTEKFEKKMKTNDSQTKNEMLKRKKCSAERPSASSKILKESAEKRNITNITKKKGKNSANVQERMLARKPKAEVKRSVPEKPRKMIIERTTISEQLDRHSSEKRRDMLPSGISRDHRKRRYNDSLNDDYDDEMDEFIDDSEAAPDISGYIKEIFGYDRRRFRERDEDTSNMESSFAEIQREEAKSSRIAKLEDEIERLKETYELQRHKKKKLKH